MQTTQRGEKVPLLTVLLGAISLFLPFIVLKENRIVSGNSFNILVLGLFPALGAVVFIITVAAAAFLRSKSRIRFYSLGILQIIFLFVCLETIPRLVSGLDIPSSRISLGAGLWLSAINAYVLIDYGRKNIPTFVVWTVRVFLFLLLVFFLTRPAWTQYSLYLEWQGRKERIAKELLNHIVLMLSATASAGFLGFIFGVIAWSKPKFRQSLLGFVNTIQTIPSLALFGLLIAPLSILSFTFPVLRELGVKGIGFTPAFIALTLYAMLPITQNTLTGLESVPVAVMEAGKGMGMSTRQLFWKIRIPLAFPVIVTGFRTASVSTVGNVAIAALIGAGGLGTFIFQGLGQSAFDLVLLGVIPIVFLAFVVDALFILLHKKSLSISGQHGGPRD